MKSTSPYAMKFAGYRIADGTMSLDLRYKVQNSQLEGANQIVIDKLTLGEKVDSPSYRVARYDIIDVRPKSMSTDPFVIAKELVGDRPIPGWLQVVPSTLRILVHQLPERAQIDTQVTEQLIVELYSK